MPLRHQQPLFKTTLKRAAVWLLRLALFLVAPELHAQMAGEAAPPYVLSERVGAVLDAEERAYFGFFPRLDGFASATLYALTDTTIAFAITRQGRPDTTITASREAAEELGRYVDQYEQLFSFGGERRLERFDLVAPLVRPRFPYRKGDRLTVTTPDDGKVSGRLLYIDEEVVVLSQAKDLTPLNQPGGARVLLPHEVQHVRLHSSISLRLLHAAIIPFAGSDSVYTAYTLPILGKKTTFSSVPSPEIRSAIERRLAKEDARVDPVLFDPSYLKRFAKRLHISFAYPFATLAISPPDLEVGTGPTAVTPREVLPPRPKQTFWVDYTLTKKMRLGGHVQQLSQPPFPASGTSRAFDYTGTGGVALGLNASYVFNPTNALDFLYGRRQFLLRRVEFRGGLGASYARLHLFTDVNWKMSVGGPGDERVRYTFTERVSDSHRAFGATSLLSADFYPFTALSINMMAHAYLFPALRVEEREVKYTGEDQNGLRPSHLKRLESGSYRLFFASFSFGLHLHL